MSVFRVVPLFALLLVAFNAMIVLGDLPELLAHTLVRLTLPSGADWALTARDLVLGLSAVALAVEIVKSARATMGPLADHLLSIGVFLAFLVEFITVGPAGNSTFMLVGLMALLHAVAGFTIALASAGGAPGKPAPLAKARSVSESTA